MRTGVRRSALSLLAAVAAAVAISACETTFDLDLDGGAPFGRAIDGNLVNASAFHIDNECQPVFTIGSTLTLSQVPSAEWARPGRRVFLHQVTGAFTESSAANATSDPGITGVWEIVPVAAVDGVNVTVERGLEHGYSTGTNKAAQACLVREYGTMTLATSLHATAWNGSAGGVLVFFASEVLVANTTFVISATGSGFAGGLESGVTTAGSTDYDTAINDGGFKGSGIDARSRVLNGRGSYRNAAGAGNANRGAGGGGAGYGNGGTGEVGVTNGSGGVGGTAPDHTLGGLIPGRLFFGGGGGGGHAATSSTAGFGGFGGGIVIGGARRVEGAVKLVADGRRGRNAVTGRGAGGGGGGGGGVVLFWTGDAGAVVCNARGGGGGTGLGQGTDGFGGVGGSGGGGACWVDGVSNVAALNSTSGEAGLSGSPGEIPDWWSE